MKKLTVLTVFLLLGLNACASSSGPSITPSNPELEAREVVEEAYYTVKNIRDHAKHGAKVRYYMEQARAVVIFPQYLKGAFVVGGEGGTGILLARASSGEWSYPAFYRVHAGSFGLQFGARSSEVLLAVMTGKGLTALLDKTMTMGGEVSVALGGEGEGLRAGVTSNIGVDILAWAINKGAYIGMALDGTVVEPSAELNTAYYGDAAATASAIVLEGQHHNPQADRLRTLLAEFPKE